MTCTMYKIVPCNVDIYIYIYTYAIYNDDDNNTIYIYMHSLYINPLKPHINRSIQQPFHTYL